jgi:hypothetical protein
MLGEAGRWVAWAARAIIQGPDPAASTDNAVARWDGTGGNLIQNSGVICDDSNNITGINSLTVHTDDLVVDAASERVGVGTASPSYPLTVRQGGDTTLGGITGTAMAVYNNASEDSDVRMLLSSGAAGNCILSMGTTSSFDYAEINYDSSTKNLTLSTADDLVINADNAEFNGGQKVKRTAVSGTYTVLLTDYLVTCSGTANYTVSLPAAATAGAGKTYMFANVHSATYNITITIDPNGGELINGLSTASLAEDKGMTIVTDGSAWYITGQS